MNMNSGGFEDRPAGEPIRVGIVDDHQVLVDAMRMIVQAQKDMQVVGDAGSCAGCLRLVRETRPQVLLLDVMLPDGDGIEQVPEIKATSPETNVLILSSLSDEATLMRAMQAGVSGFVAKSRNLPEVLRAIRQAAAGEIAVPAGLLLGLLNRAGREPKAQRRAAIQSPSLTQRELEILRLLATGASGEQIAARLTIAPLTVRTHIRNLMQKMGVRSRLEAVTLALRTGLIDPPA